MTGNPEPRPDDLLRVFIAVEISEEVREALRRLQDTLKRAPARVGWVAPENVHLTLAFLGDVFRAALPGFEAALDAVALDAAPFRFEASGAGYFGSARSPRVLWVGVSDESGGLGRLQERVATAARGLGLKVEDRPFKPHLTLGRVRSPQGAHELTSLMASAKNTGCGWVDVQRLLLMQSHLEHQGVRYSILHASALKGAQHHGG